MKWLFIKSLDTFFFRDGKPFWRGDETISDSIFPPSPRTFYGSLRSYIILNNSNLIDYRNDAKLKSIVGDENSFGDLEIYGPFIYDYYFNNIYFKSPRDIFVEKNLWMKNRNCFILKPKDSENVNYNLDYKLDLVLPENIIEIEEYDDFLKDNFLISYINNDTDNLRNGLNSKNLYEFEYKVGISIDKTTGTVEESKIYTTKHLRFKENFGFLIGVNNEENYFETKENIFRLGGETRIVYFEDVTEKINQIIENIKNISFNSLNNNKFKIILLTPALFKNGWYPDFLKNESNELIGDFLSYKIKLKGCILGKPKSIGGFDLYKKSPKSISKYVPEGSVYYFEIINADNNNNNWKEILKNLNFKTIYEFYNKDNKDYIFLENLKKEGFGQILIGGW